MGVDHHLVCKDCKVYIDLHKWPIVDFKDKIDERYKESEEQKAKGIEGPDIWEFDVDGAELSKAVEDTNFSEFGNVKATKYIADLEPEIKKFLAAHKEHKLVMITDHGMQPWDIGYEKWYEWKQHMPTVGLFLFLPRNLVEDFGLKSWDDVLKFVEKQEDNAVFYDYEEEIKEGFAHLLP